MPRKKKEETIEEKPKTTRKKADQTEILYQTIAAACNAGVYGKGKIMVKRVNSLGYGPIFTMVEKYLTIK